MSISSGVSVSESLSHMLPTQKSLSELLEKLLTVFRDESILEGRDLPSQPLQREIGAVRHVLRPMVGNDFHVQTSFGCDPSWKALLQLDLDDESDKICLPLCDVTQHPSSEEATATKLTERAAKLLRSSWPDANDIGPSKRRQLGLPFADPDMPDYQLFRWLASKDLNPVSEGVSLTHLHNSMDLLYQPLRQRSRALAVKPCPEADQAPISVDKRPNAEKQEEVLSDDSGGQIWSFTGPESWVISLPVLATILLLMAHPTKDANPLADNPDRDLSWTLDSLHGFCRKEGLEEGNRHLSWSLGTFPDCWMYLNFIFSYFSPDDVEAEEWSGSGIRCDRRTVTVPLGGPNGKETFREQRVWFSMRTATAYGNCERPDTAKLKGPATVGFVLGDSHHHEIRMRKKDWATRGMEPVTHSSGITAFQMLLWSGVDDWSDGWNACLDYIDRLHQVEVEDINNRDPEKLNDLMFDPCGQLAKGFFITAHLVKIFRRHIDALPRSMQQMGAKWEQTYPGVDSDLTQRFDEPIQLALLNNWDKLLDHADALHGKLAHRMEKMSSELLSRRDSLKIAKGY